MPLEHEISPAIIEYNANIIKENIATLRTLFPFSSKLLYSLKANNNLQLLMAMENRVDGFDIASEEEVALIIAIAAERKTLCLTGNDKRTISISSLRQAAEKNKLLYSIESPQDFGLFCHLITSGIDTEGLFRLSFYPGVRYGILNGLPGSPFGMTASVINQLLATTPHEIIKKVIGFHLYIGSQLENPALFSQSLASAIREIETIEPQFVKHITTLNLGGGFPAVYGKRVPQQNSLLSAGSLSAEITELIAESSLCRVDLIFESGRAIVGSAGKLTCTILDFNLQNRQPYIVVNSGIAQIGGLYLLRRLKEPELEFYSAVDSEHTSSQLICKVFGPSCTQLDMLGYTQIAKEQVKIGTTLYCDNLGAYCSTASLNGFHAKKKINEVIIS
ncbi:hypothetical protein [Xenorhabdus bovienii]|uniref:hypothetical protein n=1 Tax=Xenorhabdus bovienii TaxID=40576 RepID=UPI003DA53D42